MSNTFSPGQIVTDGFIVAPVYEGELSRRDKPGPGRVWIIRRNSDLHSCLVSRDVKTLRPATCDEIFNACVHGVLQGFPCEHCHVR